MNKRNVLHVILSSLLLSSPVVVVAHSSSDPSSEILKYERSLDTYKTEFSQLTSNQEKRSNLQSQITTLERKVFKLRDTLAKDYPHVKANMSKYEIDYMKKIDETLLDIDSLLKQSEQMVE